MEQECKHTQAPQPKFKRFDLVWAKILGWPWWPGKIAQTPQLINGLYKIQFIGDPSHAFIARDKLVPYLDGRDRHSTPKSNYRHFPKALVQADRIAGIIGNENEELKGDYSHRSSLLHQQIQIINQEQKEKQPSTTCSKKKITPRRLILAHNKNKIIAKKNNLQMRNSKLRKTRKLIEKKQSVEEKRELVHQICKLYNLHDIPREEKKSSCLGKKSKNYWRENSMQRKEMRKYLCRALGKALGKRGIKEQRKYVIAMSLAESVLKNQEKRIKGVHRAVFQWINSNDAETIELEYESWPSEDKQDPFTFTESYQ